MMTSRCRARAMGPLCLGLSLLMTFLKIINETAATNILAAQETGIPQLSRTLICECLHVRVHIHVHVHEEENHSETKVFQ